MYKIANLIVMLLLALASFVLLAIEARADDVYNFYFQKAPGPQTVIQGGKPESAAPAPASAPIPPGAAATSASQDSAKEPFDTAPQASVTAKADSAKAPAKTKYGFFMGAGVAETRDNFSVYDKALSHRLALTMGYAFNSLIAVEAGAKVGSYKTSWSASTGQDIKYSTLPTLGVSITPWRFGLWSSDSVALGFEAGAAAGALDGDYRPQGYYYGPGMSEYREPPDGWNMGVGGFYGVALNMDMTGGYSLRGHMRFFSHKGFDLTRTAAVEQLVTLNYTF